jgi:UDP:flavonoid glycosyltransferase YjiC (YdhE family)
MHTIVVGLGTAGDVNPMLGVARWMRARGHRVTLIANDVFGKNLRSQGVEFVSLGSADEYEDVLNHPLLWHWRCGWRTTVDRLIAPALRPVYAAIRERYVPGQTLVAASTLALGARVARESLGVPLATLHIAPTMLRSEQRPPQLHGLFFPALPAAMIRFQFWMADELVVDRALRPAINQFRAELGMQPIRRLFAEWIHSPDRVIGLFPGWYAPPAADWLPQTRLTGFPLYDAGDGWAPTPELAAFLAAGEAPIVFTPGSGARNMPRFFATAVEACQRLNCRGLLITRYAHHLPDMLPQTVAHCEFAPFSWLLPRARAIVHHGGAGTTSQALAAGIPQLLTPMAYDQPDHAARVRSLGVGDYLPPWRCTGRGLAHKLDALLSSAEVAHRCRLASARLAGVNPLRDVCQLLEGLVKTRMIRAS